MTVATIRVCRQELSEEQVRCAVAEAAWATLSMTEQREFNREGYRVRKDRYGRYQVTFYETEADGEQV